MAENTVPNGSHRDAINPAASYDEAGHTYTDDFDFNMMHLPRGALDVFGDSFAALGVSDSDEESMTDSEYERYLHEPTDGAADECLREDYIIDSDTDTNGGGALGDPEEGAEGAEDAETETLHSSPITPAVLDSGRRPTFLELQQHEDLMDIYGLRKRAEEQEVYLRQLETMKEQVEADISKLKDSVTQLEQLAAVKESVEQKLSKRSYRYYVSLDNIEDKEVELERIRDVASIHKDLWLNYEAFCEAIEPKEGTCDGWSVTCDSDHQGSYAAYDPSFGTFRNSVEMSYTDRNFRAEPYTDRAEIAGNAEEGGSQPEYIVGFYTAEPIVAAAEDITTWGDQFPLLYELAIKAAKAGFEAATQMLVALPDQDGAFEGGWLFEYAFEKSRLNHTIESRRWGFRMAQKIDNPEAHDIKRARIEKMLLGESS